MQSRNGPTPSAWAAAPLRLSAAISANSPSSSSSGEQLPILPQQQLRQPLLTQKQQQQVKNAGVNYPYLYNQSSEENRIMDWGTSSSHSGAMPLSQLSRNFVDVSSSQLNEENQNKRQFMGQIVQNPLHQAYSQFPLHSFQQKTEGNLQFQQEPTLNIVGQSRMDQGMHLNNNKNQDLVSLNSENQSHMPTFNTCLDYPAYAGKHTEQEHANNNYAKPRLAMGGQLESGNMVVNSQFLHSQASMQNIGNNQSSMAQIQARQAGSNDHTGDSIAQVALLWQLNRMAAEQKQNELNATIQQSVFPSSREVVGSSLVCNESITPANSMIDYLAQSGFRKTAAPACSSGSNRRDTSLVYSNELQMQQQKNTAIQRNIVTPHSVSKQVMHLGQSCASENQDMEDYNLKHGLNRQMVQMQQIRPLQPLSRPIVQPTSLSSEALGSYGPSQSRSIQPPQKHIGFTKQQHFVFRAQMLAFRRFIRCDYTLPPEILQAIIGPTVESQTCQSLARPGVAKQERFAIENAEVHTRHAEHNSHSNQLAPLPKGHNSTNMELFSAVDKDTVVHQMQGPTGSEHAPVFIGPNVELRESNTKHEEEKGNHEKPKKGDFFIERKNIPDFHTTLGAEQVKKLPLSNFAEPPEDGGTGKYIGPIFDFHSFLREYEPIILAPSNYTNNLTLANDVKELLTEEVKAINSKKRAKNLEKINGLLTVNLERKNISPDNVLRLQIEEKKLRLADFRSRVRVEVEHQQQEIIAMNDRSYRKFVRQCRQQRLELLRQVHHSKNASIERQLKAIIRWRKTLLELHWAIRDARAAKNRGVAKYHERMLREFSKKTDDNRNRRMEALKNNDVDRYRKILLEQQTDVSGDVAQRYVVLSSFLTQTEEYLHKLGKKVVAAKNHQEVKEAANTAAAAARAEGLSEQEAKTAAASAGEEVMIRNVFSEINSQKIDPSENKYYNLAHAMTEKVIRQPSLLQAGNLRDYQIVGLQWMLSLYNNKLNGILADEMGLGKTVQVMALIAYLMEFKENYGPHLIIVPNAVLVNWKSELAVWLPSVKCVFYVGTKEQRSKLFLQEVCAVKFNVLVTTYEFVMHDRSKLSKVDWEYIIIDEAQRMKDRESVLARDLDRYHCQRRLLLTGTPLQNDLKELWSLLNLLLPEVFDNQKVFQDWFSKPFQRDGRNTQEDEWLETEKKVIIIHRLHQILEPFMLRRRVEEVEGSLPRKLSIVLKCRMSPIQSAIYEWIKSTGTIKVDPEEEMIRVQKNPFYQAKLYKNLNNKCMELRKVCNHPLLNYPYFGEYSKDFIVRSCGKLWILDRVLMKLKKAGHRVLLFSTMTKLLDILEEYMEWQQLVYRRIDGTTTLEDRESAILDFNSPKSDCFIFLLSIRAAGRGLNLQTADTVVIYDPDPNPQNEEQAVARAHRIGQTREVKVIYMEAVVEKISRHQKEDRMEDFEDYPAGNQYIGSIESLIRSNIQQYKKEMADEVINAGRFDQMTTHEERRLTLETLLHDEERYQEMVHDVPSMHEVNRMIARSDEEVKLFDQMDEELDLTVEMLTHDEVPTWLRASSMESEAFRSKKSSRNIMSRSLELNREGLFSNGSPCKTEKRRGRPKGSSAVRGYPTYRESYCELSECSDDTEDRTEYDDEEGEFKDEELNVVDNVIPRKDQLERGRNVCNNWGNDVYQAMESRRNTNLIDEAVSPASSSGSRELQKAATRRLKKMSNEPEYSQVDLLKPGSSTCDHEGDRDQFLQPKLKRKRSTRTRPRYNVERIEERPTQDRFLGHYGSWQSLQMANNCFSQFKSEELELIVEAGSGRHAVNAPVKQRYNCRSRKNLPSQRSGSLSYLSGCREDAKGCSMNSRSKAISSNGSKYIAKKMPNAIQSKCKKVMSKLQMIIQKECHQNFPKLSDWWRRNESFGSNSFGDSINGALSLQLIEKHLDDLEYNGVVEFISDVQSMLRNVVQHCNHSDEVKYEAENFQDIFFDILKTEFPDIDFRAEAMTFTSHVAANVSSQLLSSASQCKQHVANNQAQMGSSKSVSRGVKLDDRRSTPHASKYEYPHHTIPGILKRKRKNRGKSSKKLRAGSLSSLNTGLAGAPSPPEHGTSSSTPCPSLRRSVQASFQNDPNTEAEAMLQSGLKVQWAKRAKRTGNCRRPNHRLSRKVCSSLG